MRPPGLEDRAALEAALLRSSRALSDLVRRSRPDAPVPGLEWTVSETAAHVVTVVRRSLGDTRRSASPRETGRLNAQCLAELPERDADTLADLLTRDVESVVLRVLPTFPDDDQIVPFHGGITTRLLDAYGIMLCEILVHGFDIAAGGESTWTIPADDAALAVRSVLALAPAWADPALWTDPASRVSIPVGGRRYDATIGPDRTTITDTPVDSTAPTLDPVEVLLALTHRADPPTAAVATLAGSLLPM